MNRRWTVLLIPAFAMLLLAAPIQAEGGDMELGTFSISLAVKDLAASRDFYTKLGLEVVPGDFPQYNETWVILKQGTTKIGLFQGMFENNTLTFNPTDVRAVQRSLKAQGIEFVTEADEKTDGPAAATLLDPDGNPVLFDQH